TSIVPIGLVFMSKLSMLLSNQRFSEVRAYLSHLVSATICISLFVAIQLMVFADVLVRAWIGPSLLQGTAIIRILLLGIPCYLFYTALRSAVDAGTIQPLNARNVLASLITLLLLIGLSIKMVPCEFL